MKTADNTPITVKEIIRMKKRGEKIAALTAYDATFAKLEEEGGIEIILVGDSLGMVIQGHPDTLHVELEDVIYHCRACARGMRRALLVADMPFMTYQVSPEQALENAGRCIKEGMAKAVKLEGGVTIADTVRTITRNGIPVMGHVGMQPQKVNVYGGYKLQGRKEDQAKQILEDAIALQDAGVFSIVLEKIPSSLGAKITEALEIPTIGIAAGPDCDGQILVNYDLFGLADQYSFKFVRRYIELAADIRKAVSDWKTDIRSGSFPSPEESFD